MKPRTAGIVGMVLGVVVSIAAGFAIAHPPFSIPGALVLVVGTIEFAIAATWTVRKSWAELPDITLSEEKARKRFRRLAVFECIFSPPLIGIGVWQVVIGYPSGFSSILIGAMGLGIVLPTLVGERKRRAGGETVDNA